MSYLRASVWVLLVNASLAGASLAGCGDGENNAGNDASGGTEPTGGRAATGGTPNSGAAPNTGGTQSSGAQGAGAKASGGTEPTGGRTTATGGAAVAGSSSGGASSTVGNAGTTSSQAGAGGTPNTGGDDCEALTLPEGSSVFDGDLTVDGDNYEVARGYTEVTGDLITTVENAELPYLQRIGGSIDGFVHLRLPSVTYIGGDVYIYLNHDLLTLDLRNLEEVGGRLFIHRNLNLAELQLDKLTTVGADVAISANLALADCFVAPLRSRFSGILETEAPDCTCTRECGLVTAHCP